MKTLTEYFSPTKETKEDKPTQDEEEQITVSEALELIQEKENEEALALPEIEETLSKERLKKKHKKSKRKPSDPQVNGIASLLSNSLILVSPNKKNEVSPKKNAFTFMMDQRHKSIGSNSPGKDLETSLVKDEEVLSRREQLKQRKSLLEEWAEEKGGAKRKRDEEDAEILTKQRLDKRKKRLKKLLNFSQTPEDSKNVSLKDKEDKTIVNLSETPESTKRRRGRPRKEKIEIIEDKKELKNETQEESNNVDVKPKPGRPRKSTPKEEPVETLITKRLKRRSRVIFDSEDSNDSITKPSWKIKLKDDSSESLSPSLRPRRQTKEVILIEETTPKKKLKIAPIFNKAIPKPKIDPERQKARREFLLSGLDESVKKSFERTPSLQEKTYEPFPTISHVLQKSPSKEMWSLPTPNIELNPISPIKLDNLKIDNLTSKNLIKPELTKVNHSRKVTKYREHLKQIKLDNPEYPVYRVFKQILVKTNKPEDNRKMWSEKYLPNSSDDIIGNTNSIQALKKWLNLWQEDKPKKRRQSESDFDTTDGESRESTTLLSSTIVLSGPSSSGKTSAVYAICKELDINVLEVNASTKRTGKILTQQLQEATQSHQVRPNPFKMDQPQEPSKSCTLLVEDIDLVFDQDDGFLTALSQLVQTSKRPIILTTTDPSSSFVQKFFQQHKVLNFQRPTPKLIGTWLQIVCLVEGFLAEPSSITSLLQYNQNDIRKTLLQLQFWSQSGGNIFEEELSTKEFFVKNSSLSTVGLSFRDNGLITGLSQEVLWKNCPDFVGDKLGGALRALSQASYCLESNKPNDFQAEIYETWTDKILRRHRGSEAAPTSYQMTFNENKKWLKDFNHTTKQFSQCSWNRNKKSLDLDYFPVLRSIVRSEKKRSQETTKGRNRFRHYLKDFGLHCDDTLTSFACDLFKV